MKVVTVAGARPQFIKASVVSKAIMEHNSRSPGLKIEEIILHTGQHYDYEMSQVFFDELRIQEPEYHLGVGSGTHGEMTGKMLAKIEEVLFRERPDWVIVYGDTNSTLAGALAAVKVHIPVAHIEAGLRSFNRLMPEEINRITVDHISTLLFCPTTTAVENLKKEGISEGVYLVGDVMYDAFLLNRRLANNNSDILAQIGLTPGTYCLGTIHRQENTDDPKRLLDIFSTFEKIASLECPFLILLHPRTRKALKRHKNKWSPYVYLHTPASYLDMIVLESNAKTILTDSGGVQKEAFFAEVPCVTLRDETEWTETVEAGWNYLGGTDPEKLFSAFQKATDSLPRKRLELYGDGKASHLIVSLLVTNSV